ncbi:hypothetical protein ACFLRF_05830 [Candidatus Altiarchaeota archaeon]
MVEQGEKKTPDYPQENTTGKRQLLSIVLQLHQIYLSQASLKLSIDKSELLKWASDLERLKWISIQGRETDDPLLEVTEYGLQKQLQVLAKFKEKQAKKAPPKPRPVRARAQDADNECINNVTKKHLLAMVYQLKRVSTSLVAKQLCVSHEQVAKWTGELVDEGLLRILDTGAGDPILGVSDAGLSRQHDLLREFQHEAEDALKPPEVHVTPSDQLKMATTKARRNVSHAYKSFMTNVRDLLLLCSSVLIFYLLYEFLMDPNVYALNFLLGALLIALSLMLYKKYQDHMQTKKFLSFMEWFGWYVKAQNNNIAFVVTVLLMIYTTGMLFFYPQELAVYVMSYIFSLTTGILIYYPRKDLFSAMKFYLGMMLLTYSLMLLWGIVSITQLALGTRSYFLDFVVGILLLLLVQLNESTLGVGSTEFKKMLESKESSEGDQK